MNNYFELFHLPITFLPNPKLVKLKFYELSKQYHPDRYTNASEDEQDEALRMAATINDAYKTLSNAEKRMAYILRLEDGLEQEEQYKLPADFLMEMMDLNEAVSDYEDEPSNKSLKTKAEQAIEQLLDEWEIQIAVPIAAYESGENQKESLKQIKDFYFRKKYLLRIKERLATFASR
ncbi:MAG: Fe-S protein assembly co-chaperone HscB [Chitinophagaceae bacterium]|nr:Fe-S protein assembly co-chaperone HscB [Chitinophagaceae bacterium]